MRIGEFSIFCKFTYIYLIFVSALNLKEIPYEIKPVSLIKAGGEHHSNDFREVNPMEQVPALHIDGITIIESLTIMQYLEETRGHRPLLPVDVVKRAKVLILKLFPIFLYLFV